ncbi:MAG TPA: hypothetical protein VIO58_12525 [Candidatus Methanoperedens sp.]
MPELEVASAGDTPQEALENLKEAVELYLENAKALGILNDFATSVWREESLLNYVNENMLSEKMRDVN